MDSSVQAVMEGCFTNARLGRIQSFTFKCRQCTDIADFFVETGPKFRFPVWESYLSDQRKGGPAAASWRRCEQAMIDFCRAVKEAEVFLQEHCCTPGGKNDWTLCAKGLAALDTRKAYDVHLQNLIWSMAALEVAIVMSAAPTALTGSPPRPLVTISSDDVQKVVAGCRRVLCRYASSYKEHRILMDRLDFNESIQILIDGGTDDAYKYLAFLLRKSQAALPDQSSASATHPDLTNTFEISDHELDSAGNEQALGEGSFGKVYSTLWLGYIKVAVKVIPMNLFPGDSDIEAHTAAADEYFKAEVSLLARAQSPYIVQLIGWAIDRNKREGKLVTELVATDLSKVLQETENRKGLPLHVAVDMMLQVSKAMEHLHEQNIIHRDIKPSNILLEPSSVGEFWRVKICDFGVAKMKLQKDALFSTFKTGTLWYRAPEVLSEKVKYSNKADVYSFAITCSEMLGGYSATLSLSKGQGPLLSRIESNQRPSLAAECPAHLADLIRKCWHTEPDKRPPFCDITGTLRYIKFIIMRSPAGVDLNTASLLTPFDEYELKACMLGAAQMECTDTAMWDSEALAEARINEANVRQHRTRMWLESGESLAAMESVTWGRYRLTMQQDSNLVLVDCDDMTCLWASGRTTCRSLSGLPFVCTLRTNGNLAIHSGRQEVWSSGTAGSKAAYKLELDFNGRAFIRGPNGSTIWATERNVLNSGDVLFSNNSLWNNSYEFAMQSDGNLVLYDEHHRVLWASGVQSTPNHKYKLTVQEDGLLALFKGAGSGQLVWSSNKSGDIGSYKLELQRHGNVVILNPSGTCIWETDTDQQDISD